MTMLHVKDQRLDPPNPPERAKCAMCGEIFCYDDMITLDWRDYCQECAELARMEEVEDEVL